MAPYSMVTVPLDGAGVRGRRRMENEMTINTEKVHATINESDQLNEPWRTNRNARQYS